MSHHLESRHPHRDTQLDEILLWLITLLRFVTGYWEIDGGGPRNRQMTPFGLGSGHARAVYGGRPGVKRRPN
jgi:hypothetical protein